MHELQWSYSSLKTFQQCPKKYYHLRIKKDVVDAGNQYTSYGKELHRAAEDYIKLDEPLPGQFAFMQPILESLKSIEGEKHCEMELALIWVDDALWPCKFSDKGYWWRGIADLLIVNEDKGVAHLVDYKTGKNPHYADTTQLDALAVGVFAMFPKIHTIKSGLLFVATNDFIKRKHVREDMYNYISFAYPDLHRMSVAIDTGVWNPVTSSLCRYCPVTQCEHYPHRS